MLATRMRLIQRRQIVEHLAPRARLLLRVVHTRQLLAVLMIERNIREILAPIAVHLIGEARMIRVQLRTVRQNLIGEPVQITDTNRKPRHRRSTQPPIARDDAEVAAIELQLLDGLAQGARFAVALDKELVARHTVR